MGAERPKIERHGSWSDLSFVGGEEDAHDHLRDKYAFERRQSNDFRERQKEFADVVDATASLGKKMPISAPAPMSTHPMSTLYGTPAAAVHATASADPWRSVFHPGRNANRNSMRSQGANVYDKPSGTGDKSVWEHTLDSQKSTGQSTNYWKLVQNEYIKK